MALRDIGQVTQIIILFINFYILNFILEKKTISNASNQGYLERAVHSLFPGESKKNISLIVMIILINNNISEILTDQRKETHIKNPHTGKYLEIDVWIPRLDLCFEFQVFYIISVSFFFLISHFFFLSFSYLFARMYITTRQHGTLNYLLKPFNLKMVSQIYQYSFIIIIIF